MTGYLKLSFAATVFGFAPVARAPGQTADSEAARDTALLTAVVRAIITESRKTEVRVDPRPLLSDEGLEAGGADDAFLVVPQSLLDARVSSLAGVPVKTIDAIAIGQNERCPSAFRQPDPADPLHKDPHSGCPRESFYVAAVGLARPGTKALATGGVYSRETGAALGYVAVRVVRTNIGPGGANVTTFDYIMKKDGTRWKYITAVPLLDSD